MKKKLLILLMILVIIFIFIVLLINANNSKISLNLDYDKITEISMTKLPTPPKTKIINGKDDIKKIVTVLNSFKIKKVKNQNINGWVYSLNIKERNENYNITFIGNYLVIKGSWYELEDELTISSQLNNLYKDLNYIENNK